MNKSVYSNFINLIKTKQKHTWSAFFIYHFVEGELKKQTLLTFFCRKGASPFCTNQNDLNAPDSVIDFPTD